MRFPMFYLPSFFRRPKKSISEVLEDVEEEILSLMDARSSSIDAEKRFIFRLVVYSFIIFGLGFIFTYYYCWPSTPFGKFILTSIVFSYPLVVCLLKRVFRAFFVRRVNKTDERLKTLRKQKQKLLEEVMEKETFNRAQQILKRFDPMSFSSISIQEKENFQTPLKPLNMNVPNSEVRRRNVPEIGAGDVATPRSVARAKTTIHASTPALNTLEPISETPDKPRLIRPLLPRERTVIDKLIDAFVGDGPDRRYALICKECASHNGMAIQEEFDYLAFRCCYCNHFNPARKTRPRMSVPINSMGPPPPSPIQSKIISASSFDLRTPSLNREPLVTQSSVSGGKTLQQEHTEEQISSSSRPTTPVNTDHNLLDSSELIQVEVSSP